MAQYKMIRQRGATRSVCGAQSERDARLRHVDCSNVPHALFDRTNDKASQPARAVHGRPWLKQRVEESHREECATELSAALGVCERAGLRSSRGSTCAPERTPTVRLDHGTSVPCPTPKRGCLMMAVPHRRQATWRALDSPHLRRGFSRWRESLSRCCPDSVEASTMTPGPSVAT